MNDLELIREFRDDVPEPGAEVTAWARAELMDAIARAEPARRPQRRRSERRWPFLAAAVAAGVAAVLVVSTSIPGGETGAPTSAVAAVLHRAAVTAAGQPAVAPPHAGQYMYTKSRSLQESDWYDVGRDHRQSFSVRMPLIREAWIAPDGSGRLREITGRASFPSARDRRVWIASGRPALGGDRTTSERFKRGGLSYLHLTNLPTDPGKLRTVSEQRRIEGGPPGDAETFTIVGDLLRETFAPPRLRAALYEVASQLPIVHLYGRTNWTPRPGIAIGFTGGGFRHELAFDPKTAALLGERTVNVETGKVAVWTVYLASGVVGSTSDRSHHTP
ncbi:MAG: CU044_5270 family protein [Gaiellales bacterium]